jgi:SAM-dependent methyltransferase
MSTESENRTGGKFAPLIMPVALPVHHLIVHRGHAVPAETSEVPVTASVDTDCATAFGEALDRATVRLHDYEVQPALDGLGADLRAIHAAVEPAQWRALASTVDESHPLAELLWQDPMTDRARRRPRGYAGDAALIDLIYADVELPPVTSLGAAVYGHLTQSTTARAVRSRRQTMAGILDDMAPARVLSVACGHLREARPRPGVEFVALDQDAQSLAVVAREQPTVRTVCARVSALVSGALAFDQLDLIYSTGLYDYLSARAAGRLTQRLFSCLRPGGRLVIANFLPGLPETPYMELFMDWWLIYRDDVDLLQLAGAVPAAELADARVFHEPHGRIAFLELTRV